MSKYQIGQKRTDEQKLKMSNSHKGKTSNFKGRKNTEETKQRIREKVKKQWEEGFYDNRPNLSHKGKDNPSWKGGISNCRAMNTKEYKYWRSAVFERDNWTCKTCFRRSGKLEAHHIKEWAKFPELRFIVENGVTLCYECHRLTKRGRKCIKNN